MAKNRPVIKYTNKEYTSIKKDLEEYIKINYPDSYKDFSDNSFGSIMLEGVSYIGDMLSFYLDYQINESFLDSATEYNNVVRLSRQLGYKYQNSPSTTGILSFYISVPANSNGLGPDTAYLPTLLRGSSFANQNGTSFILTENVKFDNLKNEIVVADVDITTGLPITYAVKADGKVVSGIIVKETVNVDAYQRFTKITLSNPNITEILSVQDREGNFYYEVEHLAQNTIYSETTNANALQDGVPSIIKPIIVPRRFVVEKLLNETTLQFGYGSDSSIVDASFADPKTIVMDLYGKNYVTDSSFDPSVLLETDKFGIAPSNTQLTIFYRVNTTRNSNAAVGTVNSVQNSIFKFENEVTLNQLTKNTVISSLEVQNLQPIIGSVTLPSAEEIRLRALSTYSSQNRAVTREDYKALIYAMPQQYGSIAKCNILRDQDSIKRNLNLYIISEDSSGKLTQTNSTIKNNLKTWLLSKKMINDTIDILDTKIINFSIAYKASTTSKDNKFTVLNSINTRLTTRFAKIFEIGEPIYVNEIYNIINSTIGVQDAKKVKIVIKTGNGYSSTYLDVDKQSSADGSYIKCPENCIFELKYPETDIVGTIL
jgi:hypothetical protein